MRPTLSPSPGGVVRALTLLFIFALVAPLATPTRAADCPKAAISSAATDLQDARNALMMLPGDKPADTARAEMEVRVAAFIRAYMRCQPENPDVDGIAVDLARLGWATPADNGGIVASTNPGWQLSFKSQSLGQELICIAATFSITNGSDTVVLTFRHGDDGWVEIDRRSGPTSQ
jgi:hypothetical protein